MCNKIREKNVEIYLFFNEKKTAFSTFSMKKLKKKTGIRLSKYVVRNIINILKRFTNKRIESF